MVGAFIMRKIKEGAIYAMTYYPRREDTYKCEFKVSLPKTAVGIRIKALVFSRNTGYECLFCVHK